MADQKEMRKIFNSPNTIGKIGAGIGAAMEIGGRLHDGKGVVSAVAGGLASFAVQDIITGIIGGPAMMALQMAPLIVEGAGAMASMGREKAKHNMSAISGGNVGGYFNDNNYSATMRQRQLQAMGGDTAQTRQLFGNEARRRAMNVSY